MTLDDIWNGHRSNICYVAARPGRTVYVSLGHKTADHAFEDAAKDQGLTDEDRSASDWFVAEIEPDEQGRVARFIPRG